MIENSLKSKESNKKNGAQFKAWMMEKLLKQSRVLQLGWASASSNWTEAFLETLTSIL